MTSNFTRKLTIASFAFVGAAASLVTFSSPPAAHAEDKPAIGSYSKTLTFTISTTTPSSPEVDDLAATQDSDLEGKHGVDYTWSVQAGEENAIREVSGLKMEQGVIETGDDINIGVGELQECTISKSMDSTSVPLVQFHTDESPREPSTISLNFEKYETTFTEYGKDGAKGGNVEFEWKVEEGES